MREIPLSSCERDFILKAVAEKRRIDGRQAYDYRQIDISYGLDRGCCLVEIGNTRVMAQVSCQVVEPKPVRPSDGMLFINVELSPMACPSFEAGRLSDFGVEINRLLERCLKESRCIDTESLCIVSGEKVWEVRVDVHALNHDGNLIDCCSIAAISALAHFRRPDVTVTGDGIVIHPPDERDSVPLSIHHMPLCVSFAFFDQGKYLLVDPVDREEKVMDGRMVIGMNKHREICTLQITGQMLLLKNQVLMCSNIAVVKVAEITERIHKALEIDRQARAKGDKVGFAAHLQTDKVTSNQKTAAPVDMAMVEELIDQSKEAESDMESTVSSDQEDIEENGVKSMDKGIGAIGLGGKSSWDVDEEMAELQRENEKASDERTQTRHTSAVTDGALGDSSEEEETETLKEDLTITQQLKTNTDKQTRQGKQDFKKGKKKKKTCN